MGQGMRLHLRVEGTGGPQGLVSRGCGGLGVTAVGARPSARSEVLRPAAPFPRAARAPGCARVCPGSVSSAVTPSSQLLVWATSSQASSQAPVCSSEPRSQGKAVRRREARGWPGMLPALAAPGRSAETRRGQPPPQGGRDGRGAPRRAGWRLRASSQGRLCASPDFGQMRGLEAKEEMKRQRHHLVRGPMWVGGGHPYRHSVKNIY